MSVATVHPSYTLMTSAWRKARDCSKDEDHIKEQGSIYLPPTSGMVADGWPNSNTPGLAAYEAYKKRAVFPELYSEAIKTYIGIMFNKPASIELPDALEPMRERCNALGDTLEGLLRKINAEQLRTGRLGLLGDIAVSDGEERPLLHIYNELDIRNWDTASADANENDLRFVVLDESRQVMDKNFTWTQKDEYRVLALVKEDNLDSTGTFVSGVFEDGEDISISVMDSPNIKGGTLTEIPFAFINAADLNPEPDLPPLIGLANDCLTIYRGEADYRQSLFMQGQDTLVKIGHVTSDEGEATRTGAGASIDLPMGGDAKYIGVSSSGISEQREALQNDYTRAGNKAGKLMDSVGTQRESGEAIKTRIAAQAATLHDIALTGAAGLQAVLRTLAKWYGANPESVVVTPNLEFANSEINGQTLSSIMSSKMLGAPISYESIHSWMSERGLTEFSFEEEMELINKEEPLGGNEDIIGEDNGSENANPNDDDNTDEE